MLENTVVFNRDGKESFRTGGDVSHNATSLTIDKSVRARETAIGHGEVGVVVNDTLYHDHGALFQQKFASVLNLSVACECVSVDAL